MTFEEWFDRYTNEEDGFWDYHIERLHEEGKLSPSKVKDLMETAWDARYNTLTYHDI